MIHNHDELLEVRHLIKSDLVPAFSSHQFEVLLFVPSISVEEGLALKDSLNLAQEFFAFFRPDEDQAWYFTDGSKMKESQGKEILV